MMSTANPQALQDQAITERQALTLNLYTPITKEEWERNQAIVDKVLDEVFGE